MKTVQEIIDYLKDEIETEAQNCREQKEHLWSQAAGAMDALQATLDFIEEKD